jgi:MYXO-CTERM domain-containing protein
MTFDPFTVGISPLLLAITTLGDANGAPLIATAGTGSITVTTVTPVPEPGTSAFLALGLLLLLGAALRLRQAAYVPPM